MLILIVSVKNNFIVIFFTYFLIDDYFEKNYCFSFLMPYYFCEELPLASNAKSAIMIESKKYLDLEIALSGFTLVFLSFILYNKKTNKHFAYLFVNNLNSWFFKDSYVILYMF